MNYTKIKENLSKIGSAITLTTIVGGMLGLAAVGGVKACNERPKYERGTYQGYDVTVSDDKAFREIFLSCQDNKAGEKEYSGPRIEAMDYGRDGRFDTIKLLGIPKGHALEGYANLEKLQEAYQSVVNANRNH